MLSPGNQKLGSGIYSFSLPVQETCPGKTEACLAHCYAKRGHFSRPSVKDAYAHNWQESQGNDFVAEIVAEILSKGVCTIRVHASGDLYSASYIRKWVEIAKQCRRTTFYLYTRSWRSKRLRPALYELSQLRNVLVWFSADQDTGKPPRWKRVRVAYMLTPAETSVPDYTDLVFRTGWRTEVLKYFDGRLVCPAENGVQGKQPMTCSQCQLCYTDRPIPQKLLAIT